MSIMKRLRAAVSPATDPIRATDPQPPISMPRRLRSNATGLEATYGNTQFVQRIRAAANALEELETALVVITLNTKDEFVLDIANEALDRYAEMRK